VDICHAIGCNIDFIGVDTLEMFGIQVRILIFIFLIGLTLVFSMFVPLGEGVSLRSDLAIFPSRVGIWTSYNSISPETFPNNNADQYIIKKYKSNLEQELSFSLYYWNRYKHYDNALSGKNVNPGWDWTLVENKRIGIDIDGKELSVNSVLYSKGMEYKRMIFWYETSKGVTTDHKKERIHRALDAILNRKTNVALVIISTEYNRNERDVNIEDYQLQFIKEMYPLLHDFLPFTET